jgi:hypothetical protein
MDTDAAAFLSWVATVLIVVLVGIGLGRCTKGIEVYNECEKMGQTMVEGKVLSCAPK